MFAIIRYGGMIVALIVTLAMLAFIGFYIVEGFREFILPAIKRRFRK